MTPKISLVAVCCSNDSLSSWNSRTFSMAMTAWSAKVSRSLICAGVKGRTSVRRAFSVPMSSPCWRRGAAKKVRQSLRTHRVGESFCSRTSGTWSVPCSRTQRSLAHQYSSRRGNGYGTKMSPRIQVSPSWSRSTTSSIPQTRAALSTMASRTGCTSVGERLMMPSTSAVAV